MSKKEEERSNWRQVCFRERRGIFLWFLRELFMHCIKQRVLLWNMKTLFLKWIFWGQGQQISVLVNFWFLLRPVNCFRRSVFSYDVLKQCLSQMEGLCASREKGYELGVKAAVLQLLFLLIRKYPSVKEVSSPDREQLKMVLHKIEKNIDENLTVGEMAKFCGWSDSHFMRWFKKMTGQGFTAYLNDHRLNLAAELLRITDATVLDIAGRVGFDNLSYFNRLFKRRYGMTPREYRSK